MTLPAISDPRVILRAVREKQSKTADATLATPPKTLAGGGESNSLLLSTAYANSSHSSHSSRPAIPRHNSSRETTIERNRLVLNDINRLAPIPLPELWQSEMSSEDHARTPARVARTARVLPTNCDCLDIDDFAAARVRLEQIDGPARDDAVEIDAPARLRRSVSAIETQAQRRLYRARETAGLPREWIDGAMLLSSSFLPCPGFRDGQWSRTYNHLVDFLTGPHAVEAARLQWPAVLLFGVNPIVGVANVASCGVLMLAHRWTVAAVTADTINVDHLVFRRRELGMPSVPIWEFWR